MGPVNTRCTLCRRYVVELGGHTEHGVETIYCIDMRVGMGIGGIELMVVLVLALEG